MPFFTRLRELSQKTFPWGLVRIERTRAHYAGDDHVTFQFFIAHPPETATKLFDGLHHRSSQIPTHVLQRVSCDVQCFFPRQGSSHSLGENLVRNLCVRLAGLFPSIRVNLSQSRTCLFQVDSIHVIFDANHWKEMRCRRTSTLRESHAGTLRRRNTKAKWSIFGMVYP